MSKEMLINVSEGEECRIALVEDGKLEELSMERTSATSHVRNIYKGRVTNVEPSIQAAFVDFGLGRNGFLHISDLMPTYFGRRGEGIEERVGQKMARRDRPPIQRCLRRGDEIVVQVIKEGIGTKGPTLSSYLSIPGRILVMMPGMESKGVSSKIEDEDERRRLRQILDSLDPPRGFGFILRTESVGKTKAEIERDFKYLTRLWENIEKKQNSGAGPMELYTEGDLVTRTVRDLFTSDIDRIVVDNAAVARRISEVIKLSNPRARNRVDLYEEPVPMFHKFGIEREIELMYSRYVPLPSGGSLVIDSTEAIVAIDVNSGKFREHADAETTAFKTDMEAADEIPRQLRLRDLGGVIICDFIDLRYERHRRELEQRLHDNFKKDRARTKLLRMSQFGIIEMTRQRMRPSLKRSIYFDCPHCKGAGLVKTPESMGLDVMRRLAIGLNDLKVVRVELVVCPDVAFYLNNKKRQQLSQLETTCGKRLVIRADPALGLDEMRLDLFDARDGVVSLPELNDALRSQPHTSQLGVRPPGAPAQGRGGRQRGGTGRPDGRNGHSADQRDRGRQRDERGGERGERAGEHDDRTAAHGPYENDDRAAMEERIEAEDYSDSRSDAAAEETELTPDESRSSRDDARPSRDDARPGRDDARSSRNDSRPARDDSRPPRGDARGSRGDSRAPQGRGRGQEPSNDRRPDPSRPRRPELQGPAASPAGPADLDRAGAEQGEPAGDEEGGRRRRRRRGRRGRGRRNGADAPNDPGQLTPNAEGENRSGNERFDAAGEGLDAAGERLEDPGERFDDSDERFDAAGEPYQVTREQFDAVGEAGREADALPGGEATTESDSEAIGEPGGLLFDSDERDGVRSDRELTASERDDHALSGEVQESRREFEALEASRESADAEDQEIGEAPMPLFQSPVDEPAEEAGSAMGSGAGAEEVDAEPAPAPAGRAKRSRRPTRRPPKPAKEGAADTTEADAAAEAPASDTEAPASDTGELSVGAESAAPGSKPRRRGTRGGQGRGKRATGVEPAAAPKSRSGRSSSRVEPAAGPAQPVVPGAAAPKGKGSADRHLIEDEPVIPEPARRPRSFRDLDSIPDDYD